MVKGRSSFQIQHLCLDLPVEAVENQRNDCSERLQVYLALHSIQPLLSTLVKFPHNVKTRWAREVKFESETLFNFNNANATNKKEGTKSWIVQERLTGHRLPSSKIAAMNLGIDLYPAVFRYELIRYRYTGVDSNALVDDRVMFHAVVRWSIGTSLLIRSKSQRMELAGEH